MTIQQILWTDLIASPRNVRKVKADITSLAASMAADGLFQNLVVVPTEGGKYEVVAGERRRRAIVQLVKEGIWAGDVSIPCEVREAESATAISYAENAQRVAMHPADAIRAFAGLAAEGHDEAAIANRYGYDPREVRRMLALASLSPKVVNALATDKIDVATAQAFTLSDDHKRQERVLKRARTAHEVRQLLTDTKITTSHRLFRFVGMEAYSAAGGTITRDLFADEGEGYANDSELVQRIADERFDQLAAEAELEGWSEVIAGAQNPEGLYSWHRLYPDSETRTLTATEEKALARLQKKRAARVAELGEDEEAEWDDTLTEIDEAIESIGTIERYYTNEAKAGAVMVITLSHDASLSRTAYTRKARRGISADGKGTPLPRPLYDQRMTEDLSRIRTAALQSEVAKNQRLAHAVLLDALLPMVADTESYGHTVQLRAGVGIQEPVQVFDINTREMASPFETVAGLYAAIPEDAVARFDWLLTLDAEQTARLLAACTGALIDATQGKFAEAARIQSADRIARAAGLDMRQHWEGGIEFFGRLTKKAMLAALTEACGSSAANNCAKLDKQALALACAERIPGQGWLPAALVTPALPMPETKKEATDEAIYSIAAE